MAAAATKEGNSKVAESLAAAKEAAAPAAVKDEESTCSLSIALSLAPLVCAMHCQH